MTDVRLVQQATVWKGTERAATLTRREGAVAFAYVDGYAGPPVATSLPVQSDEVLAPAGAVPPFFAGLLPEGRRLLALTRDIKTSPDDELSLLLAVGSDAVGDVSVVPSGELPGTREAILQWSAGADISFTEMLDGLVDRKGIAGVQDKVSAAMVTLPARATTGEALLKLTPPEFPYLVDNEAYFLGLARRAGLSVPDFRLVHDREGIPGLLIQRFDRIDSPAQRLAVEDASQVLGLYPAQKYMPTAEEACLALIEQCAARPVAARCLFRMMVFAVLTGNGDLHAKNLSILAVGDEWRIAPAYDLPSSLPYGDTRMALRIGGREEDISRRTLLDFATEIGLPSQAATRSIDEMLASTEDVIATWTDAAAPFTRPRHDDVLRHLLHRRRLLEA